MKGTSDAIERSFKRAGEEIDDLTKIIDDVVTGGFDDLSKLSRKENIGIETNKITEVLAEAMNIRNVSIES